MAQAVEEDDVVDQGRTVRSDRREEHDAASQRPGGVQVGAADDDEDRGQDANDEDQRAVQNAASAAMGGVEPGDVGDRGKDDAAKDKKRPVGRERTRAFLAEAQEHGGDEGQGEKHGIRGEMHRDMKPMLPENAVGIHRKCL